MLKNWISNSTEVLLYSIADKPAKIGNKRYNYFERKQLLDKMKELENKIDKFDYEFENYEIVGILVAQNNNEVE